MIVTPVDIQRVQVTLVVLLLAVEPWEASKMNEAVYIYISPLQKQSLSVGKCS